MLLQDFLTSAFLVTSRDVFLTRAEAGRLACAMGDARGPVQLPLPALLKPMELWTGKQLFSLLLRPHASVRCSPHHCNLRPAAVALHHTSMFQALWQWMHFTASQLATCGLSLLVP